MGLAQFRTAMFKVPTVLFFTSAIMVEAKWYLVETESNSTVVHTCMTVDGPDRGANCVFPFTLLGKVYTECTTVWYGKPWCSTLTNQNGDHVMFQGKWGYCASNCPTEEGTTNKCRFGQQPCNDFFNGISRNLCCNFGETCENIYENGILKSQCKKFRSSEVVES